MSRAYASISQPVNESIGPDVTIGPEVVETTVTGVVTAKVSRSWSFPDRSARVEAEATTPAIVTLSHGRQVDAMTSRMPRTINGHRGGSLSAHWTPKWSWPDGRSIHRQHSAEASEWVHDMVDMDQAKLAYLELLRDHEQTHETEIMELDADIMERLGLNLTEAFGMVRALARSGFVVDDSGLGQPAAHLLDPGRVFVSDIRTRRADPVERAARSRRTVLMFTYRQKLEDDGPAIPGDIIGSGFDVFLGQSLDPKEIYRAADYLIEKGLLSTRQRNGSGEPQYLELTALGEDCATSADGDVAAFLTSRRRERATYETTISGGAGIVVGSSNFTQNVNVGIDPKALREVVAHLMPELAQFGDAEQSARAVLVEIAEESEVESPNSGRVSRAFGHLLGFARQVSAPLVIAYLRYKGEQLGVLPPDE